MKKMLIFLPLFAILSCTDPTIPNEDIMTQNCEKSINMLDGAKLEGIIGFCVPDKNYSDHVKSEGQITISDDNVEFHLYTIDESTNYDTTIVCNYNCIFGLDYELDSIKNIVTFIEFHGENSLGNFSAHGRLQIILDYMIIMYFDIDDCIPYGFEKGSNYFDGQVKF